MSQLNKGVVLLFLVIFSQVTFGQNYYNSPYTNYKVGDLINNGFAINQGMGGSSIALRQKNTINYLNPASYTEQDTNSFLFLGGFTGRFVNVKTDYASDYSSNMNIEYLAIGFPIKKWLKMSIGLVPYSRIQYAFSAKSDSSTVGEEVTTELEGFGGFNQFYFGASTTIKNIVSFGINVNYLFGSLDRTKRTYLSQIEYYSARIEGTQNLIASDFYTKVGFQFHPTILDKHKIILGATLDAATDIKVKLENKITRYNTSLGRKLEDSLSFSMDTIAPLDIPTKLAIGLSYTYDNILTVTGEYIRQDWAGTNIEESSFKSGLYESIRFGAEYNPSPLSKKTRARYYKRMKYRMGGYMTKSYLYHTSGNISSMGLTVGLGFPLKNSRKVFTGSAIDVSYQYGIRGTTNNGLIQENYHIISLGFTLQDFWFLKPKYD